VLLRIYEFWENGEKETRGQNFSKTMRKWSKGNEIEKK